MPFLLKFVELFITTKCTLNCRLCSLGIPYIKEKKNFPFEQIVRDIDRLFEICDGVERIQPMGGEPFLHSQITDIVAEILKYKSRIGAIRMIGNSTVLPPQSLIDLAVENNKIDGCKIEFMLSNYGSLSKKYDSAIDLLEQNGFSVRTDNYNKEEQKFGGWVDMGLLEERPPYSPEQAQSNYDRCIEGHHGFKHYINGKIFPCAAAAAAELSGIIPPMHEAVDLYDGSSIESIRQRLSQYSGEKAYSVCAYCDGWNANSRREPGALQL